MSIWKKDLSIEELNDLCKNSAIEYLGIKFTQKGDEWLVAEMLITEKSAQPLGWLHGGVSCVLAETVGSLAGYMACDEGLVTVGVEINASHLRPMKIGETAKAVAKQLRIGSKLQTWQIHIFNQENITICQSRLTLAVIEDRGERVK